MLTLDKIYHAAFVLKDVARKTDLIEAPKLSKDCQLYLKTENLQVTGSFKVRGAYYKISQLSKEESDKGVIACSAGNHAQGIALSASRLGIKAVICMPAGAPISKVEATRGYGAEVVLVPGVYDDAAAEAERLTKEQGYTFAHPFNDPLVIAGQGTIGLEILEQLPDVEQIVVPIGGGGLIGGIAFAVKQLKPDCRIVGVQAAGAASMYLSRHAGGPTELRSVSTIADGIAVKKPGDLTFALCQQYVDEVVTVSEDEIAAAILALLEVQKTVAEGAGATPVAACMSGKVDTTKKTVCVVSGGNVDVTTLSRVITRGLTYGGRLTTITTKLADRAGSLANLLNVVGGTGANVVRIHHEREDVNSEVNACVVSMVLETRNADHVQKIKDELTAKGYSLLDA